MAISDVKEYMHLSDEEIDQLGRELDAIRTEVEESRGAKDAAYINRMIRIQRGLAVAGRLTLLLGTHSRKTRVPAAVAGATFLGPAQDPREHGDRPQRHARPVGLDERPGDPLLQLGVGHRAAGRAVEAQPQLRPPPVHQRARLRQRHRLRHPADGPRAEVVPVQPRAAGLQRGAGDPLPVGRGAARPRHRADPQGREGPEGDEAAAQADRRARAATRCSRTTSSTRRWPGRSGRRRSRPTRPPT